MSKQCVNCPGAVDHTTAECPLVGTIPTAEQLTEALENVGCFHDMSAELIAPELRKNLLQMRAEGTPHHTHTGERCEQCHRVTLGMDDGQKWCCYCGHRLNGDYVDIDLRADKTKPIYLYRRKGQTDFATCSKERFAELAPQRMFETKVAYEGLAPASSVDTERLDFMLQNFRKLVCERLPGGESLVYVEEGFMGDTRYPGVCHAGDWVQGSADALNIQREAIDLAKSEASS